MPPRRSARIRNIDMSVAAEPPKPVAATAPAAPPKRKRKAPAPDEKDEPATNANKSVVLKKAKVAKEAKGKKRSDANAPPKVEAHDENTPAPDDVLSVLPAEILQQILESWQVNDPKSMVILACTSKRYYSLVMAILHKRIAVATYFWAHIPNVIRRIEPHLSIAQKKQLKREGQYKGQQDKYSTRLDPNVVPPCTSFVRQMIIGKIDPGKKHKPFVLRYFEEVLKNLHNLEVFDGEELTVSMAESLAKLKNLKSLRLNAWQSSITSDSIVPLAKLRNLEHICIQDRSWGNITSTGERVLQKMLLNSLSTLQTLDIRTSKYYSDFLVDWEDEIKARNPDAMKQEHDFTALKSLSLYGISFAGNFCDKVMPNLTRAVDFLKLRELKLMKLEEGQLTFFKYLQDLFSKADKGDIHLRQLCVEMKGPSPELGHAATEIHLEGIYRFISSFDSLTTLEIHEYNLYNRARESNDGLSRRLLQSILNHPELETLRFRYRYVGSEPWEVPYVSHEIVNVLVKNLPRLRVLEFAPRVDNLNEMARALSRAKNLEMVICSDHQTLDEDEDEENSRLVLTRTLLEGFMENACSAEKFVWEEHYKLNRIFPGWIDYSIGSGLKRKKGFEKPVKITKGDCMVMIQDLRDKIKAQSSEHYYVAKSRWVDYVAQPVRGQEPPRLAFDDW
ncbi:hypothetical protein FBEOM_866 [Fusarium beomiforme]|uniref:F-box domain-containing protein n=1 Tax=Fusarium beomiforme TaxID=44412 RepID=A0A9P5E4E9_9HYPO|nr:hypothetical protein FBEOM_866 [Fusarium beomiforme]